VNDIEINPYVTWRRRILFGLFVLSLVLYILVPVIRGPSG